MRWWRKKQERTGDGRPLSRWNARDVGASWDELGRVWAFADSVDGERLVWQMNIQQARQLRLSLDVCIGNLEEELRA